MAIDYTLGKGETIDAYNSRIAAARGGTNPSMGKDGMIQNIDTSSLGSSSAVSSIGLDPKTVSDMLQADIGSISSSNATIDSGISSAIQSQRDAASANQQYVESQFARESGYLGERLTNQRTSLLEAGRGGAQGAYALQLVDKEIEKSMRDLDMRKNELILQGNSAAASKISDLQVKQMEMKVDAQQRHFTNLLGLGGYQESVNQRLGQERQQARQMTMEQLNYNLSVQGQADTRSYNASQLANDAVRLNIMQSELDLKERAYDADAWMRKPIRGFPNVGVRGSIIASITPQLQAIAANKQLTEAQKYAELGLVYSNLRLQYGGVADETELRKLVYGPSSGGGMQDDLYGPEVEQLDNWIGGMSSTAQSAQTAYSSPLQKAVGTGFGASVEVAKAGVGIGGGILEFMYGAPGKTY